MLNDAIAGPSGPIQSVDEAATTLFRRAKLGAVALAFGVLSALTVSAAPITSWPSRAYVLAVSGILVAACAITYVKYYRLTLSFQTTSRHPAEKEIVPLDIDTIISDTEKMFRSLDPSHVIFFHDMLVVPHLCVERITDHVEPMTRSILVRTTLSIRIPETLGVGEILLPLHRQSKGDGSAGFRFYGQKNSPISALPSQSTITYTAAALRFLVWSVGSRELNAYIKYFEPTVISALVGQTDSESVNYIRSDAFKESFLNLSNSKERYPLLLAGGIITHLAENQVICVSHLVKNDHQRQRLFGRRIRMSYDRRHLPRIRLVVKSPRYEKLVRRMEALRRAFGVRPTLIYFSLINAERAGSYHVDLRGPEGTYLARQEIRDSRSGGEASSNLENYSMTPRRGQRHSDLYIDKRTKDSDLVLVSHFFERMPGSMGGATWSALAAAIIITFCALVSMGIHVDPIIGSTDLVAILLAFPVVIALWAGIDRSQSLLGDVMIARVSKIITITLAISTAALYTLGPIPFIPTSYQWIFIISASILSLVACVTSWSLRAHVHNSFIKRSDIIN